MKISFKDFLKPWIDGCENAEELSFLISDLQYALKALKAKEDGIVFFTEPISKLNLSVRAYNCLHNNTKITTIGELVQRTEDDLYRIKNFGRKSIQEIKDELARIGLSLGMYID